MANQNLANKYRPKTFDDMVEQNMIVDMVKRMCENSNLTCRNFLFIGPPGTGKAQPLYSKVLTPEGFIEMKDVHVGTKVFTGSGNIGTVSGVYPQGKRPIYEITLQDRTKIRVSDEHLNVVYRYNADRKCREDFCLTTNELLNLFNNSRFKIRIDIPTVDWADKELPVDPYLLGCLIGDGSLSNGNFDFSNSEPDVVEKVSMLLERDWKCKLVKLPGDNVDWYVRNIHENDAKYLFYQGNKLIGNRTVFSDYLFNVGYPRFDGETLVNICINNAPRIFKKFPELQGKYSVIADNSYNFSGVKNLQDIITKLGLAVKSCDKHIPVEYLLSSREQRLELLRGLFDTDGYTSTAGLTDWTTTSEKLSEDFSFLVRSLGIRDTVTVSPCQYVDASGRKIKLNTFAYTHFLKIPNNLVYCSSLKHRLRMRTRQNDPMRNIVSIEYVGEEECQCIMVDHLDHTYISDGFIPTHNTTLSRIIGTKLNGTLDQVIEIDAASHNGVDYARELVAQAQSYPVGTPWKIFIVDECHSLSSSAWQTLLKVLEDGPAKTIWLFCTTNPEKIPATIISRVQVFQLSKISLEGITNRLKYIIDAENSEGRGLTYTEDAVQYIAKMSNGGMRDAITTLDKALAYSNDLTIENVVKALGLPSYDEFFDLLSAYAKKDNAAIAKIIDNVYNSGVNFIKWFENFHSFVIQILKYVYLQDINYTTIPSFYDSKLSKYNVKHANICLKLANILVKLNSELKSSQYLQELALTYLCSINKEVK